MYRTVGGTADRPIKGSRKTQGLAVLIVHCGFCAAKEKVPWRKPDDSCLTSSFPICS